VQQYEASVEISPALRTRQTAVQRCRTSDKTPEQQIAATAAAKLEEGDVKGAIRILCSDDMLAAVNTTTLNELRSLHPCAPLDWRPAPSTVVPPLQVFPVAAKNAINSFPNGSAGGPDGLRPQHLKDLLLGVPDDHPLLLVITDLVNLQPFAIICDKQEDRRRTSYCCWLRLATTNCQGCMLQRRKPVQLFWRQVSWDLG